MDKYEDIALVKLCLKGNSEAFEILLDRYQKPIFNLVFRMCNNFDDAEDITQLVFIKVYKNLKSYNNKYKFFSWVYRIAINETLNQLKQKVRLEELSDMYMSKEGTPDDVYNQVEISETIQKALMELESNYRIPIILRHFHNCTYQDMSNILHIPEKTIKSRLFTARQLLGQILISKDIKAND
jgi:RNA polymerase sigma-70 factor (ECF subfamily)